MRMLIQQTRWLSCRYCAIRSACAKRSSRLRETLWAGGLTVGELSVAALGVAVVLGGILLAKLHPLIAMLLGTVTMLLLTPQSAYLQQAASTQALPIAEVAVQGQKLADPPRAEAYWLWRKSHLLPERTDTWLVPVHQRRSVGSPWFTGHLANGERLSLPGAPGDRWVPAKAIQHAEANRWVSVGQRLRGALGKTFGKVGLPIVMAAIIAVGMLGSGAASRVSEAIERVFGPRRAKIALSVSAFLLAMPVYFDTVFYLLLPLAKAHGRRHSREYLGAVLAVIVGASIAHSLVPPTPGPLFVAAALDVSVGAMMLGGIALGSLVVASGYLYGQWSTAGIELAVPQDDPGSSATTTSSQTASESPPLGSQRSPSLGLSVLPIALPLFVLGVGEIRRALLGAEQASRSVFWAVASDPGLVLLLAAMLSLALLRRRQALSHSARQVHQALAQAGVIVLLTTVGGAFGAALQGLRINEAIAEAVPMAATPFGLLAVGFAMTVLIRGAQGSATVAMITSVSIVAPIAATLTLPFHPVYLALGVGCGSKPLAWMNDSAFWQISTMTGMTPGQTLRTSSAALTVMGVVGFVLCLLGAWLLPLR